MTAFWRYWSASAVSKVGSGISVLALPLAALYLADASPFEVSLIAAGQMVGWGLLGLPAGVIASYLPLRGIQVGMDLVRATTVLSLPLAYWLAELTVAHMIAASVLIGLCNVMFDVSNSTFLTSVVPADELQVRNSWLSGMHSTTQLAGPSLGGVVVQVLGAPVALVLDSVSYLASAMLLGSIPTVPTMPPKTRPRLLTMIAEGWRYVMGQAVMRATVLQATAANFVAGGLLALIPVYLVRVVDVPAVLVGPLLAAEGLGGLVGAVMAPRVVRRWGTAQATIAGSVASALLLLTLPAAGGLLGTTIFALGSVGYAAGVVVTSVNTRTFRQVSSPADLLSRVMATVRFVSWGVVPLGGLLAGLIARQAGVHAALWSMCLLGLLSPAFLLASPIRRMKELHEPLAAGRTASR